MQTQLTVRTDVAGSARSAAADAVLRSCVHCGFCNSTCPTYLLLGDELDGPRGRIYLIKQMLEGRGVTKTTQTHLDRCLTCRSCETTCPSGVKYHTLLDLGRREIEQRVPRPLRERLLRASLRFVLTRPALFHGLFRLGALGRPLLWGALQKKIPRRQPAIGLRPKATHQRRVLIVEGCVQSSLSPNTNVATARVLDHFGIETLVTRGVRCCGAIDYHLEARSAGLDHARNNIDRWWPAVEAGAEAIIQTASGCGAFIKEYGEMLASDPVYAAKAETVSRMALDLVEVLRREPLEDMLTHRTKETIAFHCPCTLQHAQRLGGEVEHVLQRLGFRLSPVRDSHLCCGSAGTYSITQPDISRQLRDRKLNALESGEATTIATANIGCQVHLSGAARLPVTHWIELVDRLI